ncbi:Uncharacterised protein [Sphingobacterium daejeonense]|nr:Uncharacterised protein [Sphingobacterium daejeonense]
MNLIKDFSTYSLDGVSEGQGFHVHAKLKHQLLNKTNTLKFIVTPEPKSHGEQIDL